MVSKAAVFDRAPVPTSPAPVAASAPASKATGAASPDELVDGSEPPDELDEELLLSEVAIQLDSTTSLERRFSGLATWLELRTKARAVFVADAEGLAITETPGHERYMAAASEIATVLGRLGAIAPDPSHRFGTQGVHVRSRRG